MSFSPGTSAIAAFCKDLREARGYRQVTLFEVAEITRINREFIEALESGRWDEIPPAYLRGYLALYGQAVGMNREKVLRSFDQMMAPGTAHDKAVLDDGPRLLKGPEHAEVTRAKIRTAWFAALSRNRGAMLGVTIVALLALFGLLHWSRRAHDLRVAAIPFSVAVHENRSKVHGPLTVLPLSPGGREDAHDQATGRWITCVGLAPGVLVASRDGLPVERRRYGAYDTIKVEFVSDIMLTIHPVRSAVCSFGDSTLTRVGNLAADTALYRFSARAGELGGLTMP
jgi:transcriptional regulator with XRE-family HTH domain